MSHEIDLTTGAPAVIAVRRSMWHRLVEPLPYPPASIEEGMRLSHTDFPVIERRVYTTSGDDYFAQPLFANQYKALVRTDTNAVLSIVSKGYPVVRYADAFAVLDPLLQSGAAAIETMGALYEGRGAWIQLKINGLPQEVIDLWGKTGDEIRTYACAYASYDGNSADELFNTDERVVCNNTLHLARRGEHILKIPHRGNALARLEEMADELWGNLVDRYRLIATRAAQMRAFRPMTIQELSDCVLDEIVKLPSDVTISKYKDLNRFYAAQRHAQDKRARVLQLIDEGAGHRGDRSPWEAYNGAVQYLDHEAPGSNRGTRLASAIRGALRQQKTRIYDNLANLMEAA